LKRLNLSHELTETLPSGAIIVTLWKMSGMNGTVSRIFQG